MWSLSPPFDLLSTFSFPPSVIPTAITVDPTERFFYAASAQGDVYHVSLFRRRTELGGRRGDLEAVGGGGPGAPAIKTEGNVLSIKSALF
jgi:pre-rRNA-processing protein IPI3